MKVTTALDIGLVIRERRRSLGLDQGALAERVGVSRQWIGAIEKGKPRAEMALVLRTLRALGLDLSVHTEEERTELPSATGAPDIDIDAVIDKARGIDR